MINSGTAILPTYPDAPRYSGTVSKIVQQKPPEYFSCGTLWPHYAGHILPSAPDLLFSLIRLIQQKNDRPDVNHRINSHADSRQKKRQKSQGIQEKGKDIFYRIIPLNAHRKSSVNMVRDNTLYRISNSAIVRQFT